MSGVEATIGAAAGDALTETLEGLLPGSIVSIRRAPCEFATLAAVERLTVDFADGRSVRLFVKPLGLRPSDHPDKALREREARVYDRLLSGRADLPVPRFYGGRYDAASGGTQLLLEFVSDWSLKYHEMAHWYEAARRLGQFHAHFAARRAELAACDFLLPLRADYFHAWADRALTVTAAMSAPLGALLREALRDYAGAAELLARQPVTLVHNDLAPKNVIADRSVSPARICFVDWEMAGAGCGLLDLVHLKYGLDQAADAAMVTAYRQTLRGAGVFPENDGEFGRLMAACELHKTLYRLAHCDRWALPIDRVAQWVADAQAWVARAARTAGGGR